MTAFDYNFYIVHLRETLVNPRETAQSIQRLKKQKLKK